MSFRFVSAGNTWYLDDVKVTGWWRRAPSFVPGYSNLTVSGTSQSVNGLMAGATYHFRVRTLSAAGISSNSSVASVTTTLAKSNQTIAFPAIGAQLTTNVVTLSATASSGLAV